MLGFLCVNKPKGITSNAVIQKIKKAFNIKKIGHMGTLDPMACGILPVAVGKATRLFDYSLDKKKRYTAIFDFGYTTDTLDITGSITERCDIIPTQESIIDIIKSMIGDVNQIPPNYSAKNINGRRAYDLAREGVEFELKPKKITIFKLDLIEKVSDSRYKFDIVCSSGTYIRSIARDIANALGTHGCMSYLERTETGVFTLDSAVALDELLKYSNIEDILISPLDVFENFNKCIIDDNECKDLINGKKVIHEPFNVETFIICNSKIVGIAKPNLNYISLNIFLYE